MVGIWGRMALRVVSQCLSAVLECHQGALLPGSGCILFACAGEPGARMTMQICSHSPQGQPQGKETIPNTVFYLPLGKEP